MNSGNIFIYIQKNFYAALAELTQTETPWTRWNVELGYPNAATFEKNAKMFIYVQLPTLVKPGRQQQGQGFPGGEFDIIVGGWANRVNGGVEEIAIFDGKMAEFFLTPTKWSTKKYDVTTEATFTDTTLYKQGVHIFALNGPNRILDNVDDNEFRHEFTIKFRS